MFVYAEKALRTRAAANLTPFRLSSLMGSVESLVLLTYVSAAVAYRPGLAPADLTTTATAYAPLVVVDGLHALSFFATLGAKGAVSAAMLKGVQAILVYTLSATFFCDAAAAGCATPAKSAAVAVVVAALGIFYSREPPRLAAREVADPSDYEWRTDGAGTYDERRGRPGAGRPDGTHASDEEEALLEKGGAVM